MYVKNVSLLSLTRCTLYIIPIITSLESALCYENCLLCKAVWFVSYVSAWKWKDCQSWMENCFNFDLWHSEHLLVQFIPPPQLVWRNLRGKDQSLIQFVTLIALASFSRAQEEANKQT